MQNNVSGNTLLASLTTPSKNTGRDAASARKDTQESSVNFREAMDQMARLKVDARRDQLAARASKQTSRYEEPRADKQESRADKLDQRRIDQQLRSEEHTSELQSRPHLVCRLLLEKKKKKKKK